VRTGGALAGLSARLSTTTTVGSITGTVEQFAAVGSPIEHGVALYTIDDTMVQAVLQLDSIGEFIIDPDADPEVLESALPPSNAGRPTPG